MTTPVCHCGTTTLPLGAFAVQLPTAGHLIEHRPEGCFDVDAEVA